MAFRIGPESPAGADAVAVVAELEASLAPSYPPESRHGYGVDRLLPDRVHFLLIRGDGIAVGCGGVQLVAGYGELKRMYLRPAWRGRGSARRLVAELALAAAAAGATSLRLETGIHQREAIGLYRACGFRERGPFGDYRDDPLSLFFERDLPW